MPILHKHVFISSFGTALDLEPVMSCGHARTQGRWGRRVLGEALGGAAHIEEALGDDVAGQHGQDDR